MLQFDNTINLELKPVASLRAHTYGIDSVQFNPVNPAEMMSASHDENICFWDLNKMQVTSTVHLPGKGIWCAEYSADGKSVFAGTSSTKLFKLHCGSNKYDVHDFSSDLNTITSLSIHPSGKYIGISGSSQKAVFLDAASISTPLSSVSSRIKI
jgi:WD40 repeat protein